MKVPHPIPYQGSKRNIAKYILLFFPQDTNKLIEPFAGSAAISIASAWYGKASSFYLNDINEPLMELWREIIEHPNRIAENYRYLWEQQRGNERRYYDFVRDEFNRTKRPDFLLYLLARCVKASVRYNAYGEFNQSPDNRRLGRNPQQMTEDIISVSKLFQGKTIITSNDYRDVLIRAKTSDLVYMDPPYQGVCSNNDPRYFSGIELAHFMYELEKLDKKGISFILSYDGRTGKKSYGIELPKHLGLYRLEVNAGRSSQATLLGRDEITYESVYLSRALVKRLNIEPSSSVFQSLAEQPTLFDL